MNLSRRVVVVVSVVTVHAAFWLWLITAGWQIQGDVDVCLLGIPFGQGSLIAIWGALSRLPSYVRFLVGLGALAAAWFSAAMILDASATKPEGAGWAVMFVTQAALVVAVIQAVRFARWIRERRRNAESVDGRAYQYGVGTLLVWTTVAAVVLATLKWAWTSLGWSVEIVRWQYFFFCPLIGVFNAACALAVLWSLLGRRWWLIARIIGGIIVVGSLGALLPAALAAIFGETGGVDLVTALIMIGSQGFWLYATLLPLRWAGCFGTTGKIGACGAGDDGEETVLVDAGSGVG